MRSSSARKGRYLAPCLLICLACATPFPFEKLEEGMTYAAVREEFGEPETVEAGHGGVGLSWIYLHEELEPIPLSVGPMPLRVAVASIWGVPFTWFFGVFDLFTDELTGVNWNFMYVDTEPVVLHFDAEKLVRFEVFPDTRQALETGSGYSEYDFQETPDLETWDWIKAQRARQNAMEKAAHRYGKPGLSDSDRSQIKHYYKKVRNTPNMSKKRAVRIKDKIKKVGK